jgi:hypothetical protein
MARITAPGTYLKDLRCQAKRLTSTALSLTTLFAKEENRLIRSDEASRLKLLYSFIKQQVERGKHIEDAASYGHSQGELILTLGGLAASGIIRMVSGNKQLASLTSAIFTSPTNRERPYGLVMVCIGPNGVPDDIEVVSISQLARKSNRDESEVINEIRERGYLLLSEKAFSLLIDKLIDSILDGSLRLPASREKLSEIMASDGLKLEPENQ